MRPFVPTPAGGSGLVLAALILALTATDLGAAGNAREARREAMLRPRLVLGSPGGNQREVAAPDLRFVFFKRTYYTRHAPRSESPGGTRVDVEDKRAGCRCLRFQDWTRERFVQMRQIEITYPEDGRQAMVRYTSRNGGLREIHAGEFFGGATSLSPRFTATIDGVVREFPLMLGGSPDEHWPDERLLRILFLPPPPPAPTPAPPRRRS